MVNGIKKISAEIVKRVSENYKYLGPGLPAYRSYCIINNKDYTLGP